MSTIHDILLRGKTNICREGWSQGSDAARGKGRCASTAMFRETYMVSKIVEASAFFRRANDIKGSIVNWNDAPERTQTEVLAAFDKAIELAIQEGK